MVLVVLQLSPYPLNIALVDQGVVWYGATLHSRGQEEKCVPSCDRQEPSLWV